MINFETRDEKLNASWKYLDAMIFAQESDLNLIVLKIKLVLLLYLWLN